jgi:hypothetical protein
MTKDEALKLALEALEEADEIEFWNKQKEAITAIKEALAQPEACHTCAEIHAVLDADESEIIRNAQDGYPEGRTPHELTLLERVTALCTYAADWKRWCVKAEALAQPVQEPDISRPKESDYTSQVSYTRALEAYCDTLAQPAQEPFGHWHWEQPMTKPLQGWFVKGPSDGKLNGVTGVALYTTPQQHPWVGLTNDEISATSKGHIVRSTYARAIEAKLKEKNT